MEDRVLQDRYALGRVLGAGGMARVYEARDQVLERTVAVKLLRDDIADDAVARERFLREARRAGSIAHPNAVTVFDAGVDGTTPWLVMELVDGDTLAARLRAEGPMAPAESVRVADQLLGALGAAHAKDFVHRDVKPTNVLFTRDGTAKLADFGIAKGLAEAASGLTATGQMIGTPRYLAPEQVAGEPTTARTDLYALGVLLYELLAGVPPFTGDTPVAVAVAHQQAPVPPLASYRADLPPALVAAVERALAKAPADRFADAAEMRAALRAAVPGAAGGAMRGVAAAAPVTRTAVLERPITGVSPAPAAPVATGGRSRAPMLAVLGVVGLLALAAFGLGLADTDSPGTAATGPLTLPPTTAPATPAPTPTTPAQPTTPASPATTTPAAPPDTPDPDPTWPTDLPGLIAVLGGTDPRAYGEKGPDVLDKLLEVADEDGDDQAGKARDLQEEVAKWVEEGELDPVLGAAAVQALQPLAANAPRDDDDDDDD